MAWRASPCKLSCWFRLGDFLNYLSVPVKIIMILAEKYDVFNFLDSTRVYTVE